MYTLWWWVALFEAVKRSKANKITSKHMLINKQIEDIFWKTTEKKWWAIEISSGGDVACDKLDKNAYCELLLASVLQRAAQLSSSWGHGRKARCSGLKKTCPHRLRSMDTCSSLVALFQEVMEPLGGAAWLEEVHPWGGVWKFRASPWLLVCSVSWVSLCYDPSASASS